MQSDIRRTVWTLALSLLVLGAALVAAGCGSSGSGGKTKLSLVAYSTPQEAYEALIPAFKQTTAGNGVGFTQSYGASGDQERAVEAGLQADVVALSLEPDIGKLVKAGKVAGDWNSGPHKGFVTNSLVVFTVRKGNPKQIRTWDDLLKPGVDVITPNPFTSGGARWNIMAAIGAQEQLGKSEGEAIAYLGQLFGHVSVQPKSAREALQIFAAGKGDVLISYENEAITAQQKGQAVDYVIPDQTILIENPAAVVSTSKHAGQAKAFLDYLNSDAAQKIYAEHGYRPVDKSLVDTNKYPTPPQLFRIEKFGGWSAVNDKFFDPDNGLVAKVEHDKGVSTAK